MQGESRKVEGWKIHSSNLLSKKEGSGAVMGSNFGAYNFFAMTFIQSIFSYLTYLDFSSNILCVISNIL